MSHATIFAAHISIHHIYIILVKKWEKFSFVSIRPYSNYLQNCYMQIAIRSKVAD